MQSPGTHSGFQGATNGQRQSGELPAARTLPRKGRNVDVTSGPLPDLFQRLEDLNGVGVALSRERDLPRLLDRILLAAKNLTCAAGGTLYRVVDQRELRFEVFRNDTLAIAMGGATGHETTRKTSSVCCS